MNLYQDTDKFSVEKYGSHEEWLKNVDVELVVQMQLVS